jgi:hypothetical protein
MVHGISKDLARFATAARAMIEGDLADGAAGRSSSTLFLASDGRHPFMDEAAIRASGTAGLDIVILQFGTGSKASGPRCWTVGAVIDGVQVVERDCALWIGAEGRALLVPRGVDADGWLEMTDQGLVRRSGRPAASLAAGMIRATNRLVRLSKTARTDGCIGLAVVDKAAVA